MCRRDVGMQMLQDCFPARLAVVYVLHPPTWLRRLMTILRPLLRRDTLQQKFVLLPSVSELHEHLPQAALPAEVPEKTRNGLASP